MITANVSMERQDSTDASTCTEELLSRAADTLVDNLDKARIIMKDELGEDHHCHHQRHQHENTSGRQLAIRTDTKRINN